MAQLDVTPLAALAIALDDHLSPQAVGKAVTRGVNKAAVGVRAKLATAIRQDFNAPAKALKAALPISKATFSNPVAEIQIDGRSIPLVDFLSGAEIAQLQAKPRDGDGKLKPVMVKIHKSRPKVKISRGFYIDAYKTLARREGKERGPLDILYGPSFSSQALRDLETMGDYASETVQKRVGEELNFEVLKAIKALK